MAVTSCSESSRPTMSWQVPRIDQPGAYGDPFAMHSGGGAPQIMPPGLSAEEQHFFSSVTTREYEEMARRKAEHMESAEHIAPQHNYPLPGKGTGRCASAPSAPRSSKLLSVPALCFICCKHQQSGHVLAWGRRGLGPCRSMVLPLRVSMLASLYSCGT